MKYLSLFLILLFAACKKDKLPPEDNRVAGTWRLVYSAGGIMGRRWDQPKDTVILLHFKGNGTFRRTVNGNGPAGEGKYTLSRHTRDSSLIITYGGNPYWQYVGVTKDSLYLMDHFPDGFGWAYVKQ